MPLFDRSFTANLGGYYGWWMLVIEFGFIAAAIVLLLVPKFRKEEKTFVVGISQRRHGHVHRASSIVVLNGSSVPNFPWKGFAAYNPTIQEWFIMLGGLSVMMLIYMWFAKYTPLFPHAAKHGHHEGEGHTRRNKQSNNSMNHRKRQ